jgi:hypothetical protein
VLSPTTQETLPGAERKPNGLSVAVHDRPKIIAHQSHEAQQERTAQLSAGPRRHEPGHRQKPDGRTTASSDRGRHRRLLRGATPFGPTLASVVAQPAAISSFPLSAGIGTLWYSVFPAVPSIAFRPEQSTPNRRYGACAFAVLSPPRPMLCTTVTWRACATVFDLGAAAYGITR